MVAIRRPATLALQRLMSYVRRLGWGVADQAVSSLTNFALVLYVAHRVGAAQFGAFSLAYVTYSFALTASRGLASDPLMVRFSGVDLQTWRRAVGSCTGTASVVGAATGACVLVVATTVLGGATKFAFLALGLTLPALLLQDSWRFSFFALGRGRQAFLNDLVWAVALIPALFFLRATKAQNVFWFVLAWGAGAAVAAGVGLLQARVVPRLSDVTKWLSQHRDLGYRYLAENTTNSGASQLLMYSLSLILGLSAVGYIQAANTLIGPFMVLFMGTTMIGIPEAARILRRSPERLLQFCLVVSSGLVVAAVAWGAVLLVALPKGLGTLMVGPIWRPTYPLMMASVLWAVGTATWAGGVMGLRALAAARRSLRAMFFASAAYLAFGLIGALSGGVLWAVRGLAISAWFGAVLWWWQLHQAMRESATARVRGRHSAQHQQPAAKPLGRATASGPAGSEIVRPTVNETNGQLEHTGAPESTIKPELSGSVRASRKRGATGQVRPYGSPQPQPSSPWTEALPASSPRAQSPGMAPAEALFLSSLPPASSLPSRPPVSSAPLPGPTDLIARQDWSALSSVPASPMPSFTPTSWTVMVASDRKYYDRMCKARTPVNPDVTFPVGDNERRFTLSGIQMRIGRSAAHDLEPEIDLAGPPTDPGVSRLHAVLIAALDGTWTVLDPGSANGTLLNGRKIAIGDMVPLHDGDRINLGAWTVITVHCR